MTDFVALELDPGAVDDVLVPMLDLPPVAADSDQGRRARRVAAPL